MSKLEAVLRKVCAQAVDPALALPAVLSLYRSVATIARALRTERADNGQPKGFEAEFIVLLIGVLHSACDRALDPTATPEMTANLARCIGQLSTACHLAAPPAKEKAKSAPVLAPRKPIPPKPTALRTAIPAPAIPARAILARVRPIAPQDRALADKLMADIARGSILNHNPIAQTGTVKASYSYSQS